MSVLASRQPQEPWPRLREDLTLHVGPSDANGAPTWTLHDPARNQYFSIDWVAFEVISRLGLGSAERVCAEINSTTTLSLDPSDLKPVLEFLELNELVDGYDPGRSQWLEEKRRRSQSSWWKRLMHNYLFFRLPLFKPDSFLGWLAPRANFLWTPFFFKLTLVAFLAGLWGAARQWDTFAATLVDTFSWEGLVSFAGAIIAVKILHEFGHGLTAKRLGCRVPTMGIAFLVLWPMAYTDVTESWKLDSHRKRLVIASAGIATEMMIAAWCLLAWSILPDGAIRSIAFFLATTSLVATLAINASPFMRFDGYFLLCDTLGMPNLHQRSFAYARWWLRERLFRLGDSPPETFTSAKESFIVLFAVCTWLYRLVVFLGIALLVYNFFFKALGILLFVIELWYFIFRPVWHEVAEWKKRWGDIGPVVRERPAFYLGIGLLLVLILPYDVTVNTQGVLKTEHSLNVITFQPALVVQAPPPIGARVAAGEAVAFLESPDLERRIRKAEVRLATLKREAGASGFSADLKSQQAIAREQVVAASEELNGLIAERNRLSPAAAFDAVVVDRDPDLQVGQWLPRGAHVVTLADRSSWVVDCYIEESDLGRIALGNFAWFVPEGQGLSGRRARVMAIDRDASRVLSDGVLAATAGGRVLVRPQGNRLIPERSIYRVRLQVFGDGSDIQTGQLRGSVTVLGYPKSIVGDIIRGGVATFVREAGF
jgi:putative peptide zinc metalloprotease protein